MGEPEAQSAEAASLRPLPGWAQPTRVMLGSLAVSAAAFLTTLPTWIRAEVSTVVSTSTLEISGADAASTVSALALVALVASLALRLAGPLVRKLLALVLVGAGLGLALAAVGVNADPQAASLAQVSALTGTNAPANSYELTSLPLLAAACGALLALVGGWAFAATSYWRTGGKYDRSAARAARLAQTQRPDAIDAWDSLTEGKDPTL